MDATEMESVSAFGLKTASFRYSSALKSRKISKYNFLYKSLFIFFNSLLN